MINQGTIIRNSVTGDVVEFLETNQSTGGKYAKVKWLFKSGGFKPVMHVHLTQDETFEVISGTYVCQLNGEKKKLAAGESLTLSKAVPHTHYNEDMFDAEVIQTVSPALDFEDLLARLHELSEQGKLKNGEPPLLEVMVWLKKYEAKTYLAKIPVGVQNAMATILAPVGKLMGHGG